MRHQRACAVFAVIGAFSGTAWAQDPPQPAPLPPGVSVPGAHAEGDYGGSVPGAAQREKHRTAGPNTLTWVGFLKTETGGARVFLRVTSSVSPMQTVAGNELVARLPGFKLDVRNNSRPLNTKYFDTDVTRVRATKVKDGLEVRVTFAKNPREATLSTEPAPEADGGGTFVYLDF